jgi:hypothetical protein
MKMKIVASVVLALSACVFVAQAQHDNKGTAALEQFKQLAGEWVGKMKHGDMEHDMRVIYKVTSGGSAVVETIDPGSPHEMVTVIHADGNALLLTHYCMLGNQPHMKAMRGLRVRQGDESEIGQGHVYAQRQVHVRRQGHAQNGMVALPGRQGHRRRHHGTETQEVRLQPLAA